MSSRIISTESSLSNKNHAHQSLPSSPLKRSNGIDARNGSNSSNLDLHPQTTNTNFNHNNADVHTNAKRGTINLDLVYIPNINATSVRSPAKIQWHRGTNFSTTQKFNRNAYHPNSVPNDGKRFNTPFITTWDDFLDTDHNNLSPKKMGKNYEKPVKKPTSTVVDSELKVGVQRLVPRKKRLSTLKQTIHNERVKLKTNRESDHLCDTLSELTIKAESTDQDSIACLINDSSNDMTNKDENIDQDSIACLINDSSNEVTNKDEGIDQDSIVCNFMRQLATFQDRAYKIYKDSPFHFKRVHRYVCGFHEVISHLKQHRMRMILIAKDIERRATKHFLSKQTNCESSIDEKRTETEAAVATEQIPILEAKCEEVWNLANKYDPKVPILIACHRRKFGNLTHKGRPISIIGIISSEGAMDLESKLLALKSAINL